MNSNEEKSAQQLVGKKVNITVKEYESTMAGESFKYKQYKVEDPEFRKEVDSINPTNRIFTPQSAGTMDYKPSRLNVYINEEGIVTGVSYG